MRPASPPKKRSGDAGGPQQENQTVHKIAACHARAVLRRTCRRAMLRGSLLGFVSPVLIVFMGKMLRQLLRSPACFPRRFSTAHLSKPRSGKIRGRIFRREG